ncbi:hypothetical protein SEA_NIKLAS_88 [Mycobacterium Phage Niklas]|uniref:Uncharacterized protein n=1 Tax=Mycobacterium Phage Niklas TaxID=2517936 RepID=A0A482JCP3_9CAUD|nr:hypothetical protein I5H04_gp15 [Mycobacterium Phage Niklas]QBP31670.1 hypothetical protein SEA_NIKLAS_88 [Mycobacterium Phage Niklas]
MADYSHADHLADLSIKALPTGTVLGGELATAAEMPEGFKPVGYMSADEPIATITTEGEDKPLVPWQAHTIRTLQERREVSFSFQFPRQQQGGPPLWLLQLFGVTLTPAPPTVREAAVDVWDALRTLLRVLWAVLRPFPRRVADRVADAWFDAVYGVYDAVRDRWEALRAPYVWGRLDGPVMRTWTADFTLLSTTRFPRERVRPWLRRIVAHVWQAVRHG